MKLIFVRHGDPDYSIDSLTEEGWKEAEALSDELVKLDREYGGIRAFYVSTMGRAKDTASCTLKKLNRTAEECEWLREFNVPINRPDKAVPAKCCYNWLPTDWTRIPEFYDPEKWKTVPQMQEGGVDKEYDRVCAKLDEVLALHGYVRHDGADGHYYEAVHASSDAIVFFCHFAIEAALVSHIMHISPMILWHNFCACPSSLTLLNSEERREGIAIFRAGRFGDISHLYANGLKPSFQARFCETYSSTDERHDDNW